MSKTDPSPPVQLFLLLHRDRVEAVMEFGLPAGTVVRQDPHTKWPSQYVGVVLHFANSGIKARRVSRTPVWVTQDIIAPEYISVYKKEGKEKS